MLKTRSREIGQESGQHMSSTEGVSGLFLCVKMESTTAYLYAERKAPRERGESHWRFMKEEIIVVSP